MEIRLDQIGDEPFRWQEIRSIPVESLQRTQLLELGDVGWGEEPVVGELELEEADLGVLYLKGEILDTDPILTEQIQLNVPMRQLCRQDCTGLCPQCGIDRNVESCDCEDVGDPRWDALTALRDRLEN